MSKMTIMRRMQLAGGAVLLLAAGAAQAQWMWVDAKGLKQVSDMPPPPSVPLKNILKAPLGQVIVAEAAAPAATEPRVVAAPLKGVTLADREADYRKRMGEKGEQDKKLAEKDAVKEKQAAACQAARNNKAALDSGERLRTGAGRSEFMSDKERADNTVAAASFLSANCQ